MIKAFLFDLNGTMIADMPYHIKAWHKILNDLGANISEEQTMHQCYGKNDELLERVFPKRFSQQEKDEITVQKEAAYQKAYLPHLKLIDGLDNFLQQAKEKNIKMAIGSAAIMFNIDFVLDNLNIRHYFDALISADDVVLSKPNAETYLKCADALSVLYNECIVFEDVPKGVESAANAGMKTVVIVGIHHKNEFNSFDNTISFINNYNQIKVDEVISLVSVG
jgi:beta-phosphoglucomutase